MVGTLLMRGMLVGILAGLLSFAFLKVVGEPQVDRAIAFETQMDDAKAKAAVEDAKAKGLPAPPAEAEEEIVSRPTQAGIGLFTGVGIYSVAFGGLFALAFSLAYGRMAALGPRSTAGVLALLGIVAVYIVPNLKYPANPPSVGDPDTIGMRTGLYFAMMAFSLAFMVGVGMLRNRLLPRFGTWNASLIAAAVYLVGVLVVGLLMPGVNEVPEGFPATVLWQFRIASLGAQAIMWATLGLAFGAVTERATMRNGVWVRPARASA
jgi:predicted cobalt transporter CbtA